MLIQQIKLRSCRKGSRLTQSDVAFIIGIPDYSLISLYEQGKRKAHADIMLTYHLLFDIPTDDEHVSRAREIGGIMLDRIHQLVEKLRPQETNLRIHYRIAFLESVASRLVLQQKA